MASMKYNKNNPHRSILINFILISFIVVSILINSINAVKLPSQLWNIDDPNEDDQNQISIVDRLFNSHRNDNVKHTSKNLQSHYSHPSSYVKSDNNDDGGGQINSNLDHHHGNVDDEDRFTLPPWVGNENFMLTDYLTDGELERRISYNGITAKETSIGYNSSDILSLWQVSDGKRFIQLIYSNARDLIDCEYVRQKGLVQKFLYDFYAEIDDVVRLKGNFTSSLLRSPTPSSTAVPVVVDDENNDHQKFKSRMTKFDENEKDNNNNDVIFGMRNLNYQRIERYDDIPDEIRQWLNYNELKLQCFRRHEQMKAIVKGLNSNDENVRRDANQHIERRKRDLSDWLIAPNTKWCGKGHNAGKYNQLGGASRADKCCRKHDHCKLNIPGLTTKWQVFNYFPFTISHCSCDMRHRRDLSNMLRVPGTKWCGKGYSALKYSELGGYSKADRCCRQHDKSCPFWIMGFETKYGLFNWRISTLMHCKCDERFRTCLKMADSADANMVGKLFFNIVQTKCFVLKTEKVCKKRSWWGKCEKRVKRKRAHLRDNRKF